MKRFPSLFTTPKTTFQILSDLYLNYASQYLTFHIPVSAPHLILAGNIGRLADYDAYLSFLIRRCSLHEKVYLVLGSLEFQGLSHAEGLQLARHMEDEAATKGKLKVLYRKKVDVPGTNIRLLGCTLWSHIPESAESSVINKAPEFETNEGIRRWSIWKHNEEHFRDLAWLQTQIDNRGLVTGADGASVSAPLIVVVSSFTPDLQHTLPPWQVQSPWCVAHGTDLLNSNDYIGVKYWVHGSTGRTGKAKRFGIRVVSNQRGCVSEEERGIVKNGILDTNKISGFDVGKVIRV